MNDAIVLTYALYLSISITMTIWVAQTLFRNGRAFLVEVFHSNAELADSVNRLLVVGFYLINLGFICRMLATDVDVNGARAAIELLSQKLGIVLLILGAMHFFNLFVFASIRRNAKRAERRARFGMTEGVEPA